MGQNHSAGQIRNDMLILTLPTSILMELVGLWLRPCDVGSLDMALCSKALRSSWLELIMRKELVFNCSDFTWLDVGVFETFVGWCLNRKARINEIAVHDPDGSMLDSTVNSFFTHMRESLTRLGISRSQQMVARFPPISLGFPNLRRLDIGNARLESMEAAFVASLASTLEELHMRNTYCTALTGHDGVVMPALRVLTLRDVYTTPATAQLLSMCPNLTDLRLCVGERENGSHLVKVAAKCNPNLQILALFALLDLSNRLLCTAFRKLTNLQVVIVCHVRDTIDDAITILVMHSPHLYALKILGCFVADPIQTAKAIVKYAGDRITHLSFSTLTGLPMEAGLLFAKHCVKLVDFATMCLQTERGKGKRTLAQLLAHLNPQLQALDVSGSLVDHAAVRVLCERFPSLQYLCMRHPEQGSDLHCIPQLVESLRNLQLLCVLRHDPEDDVIDSDEEDGEKELGFFIAEADLDTWKQVRPNLVIAENAMGSRFWRRYLLPEFPEEEDDEGEEDDEEDDGSEYEGYEGEHGEEAEENEE